MESFSLVAEMERAGSDEGERVGRADKHVRRVVVLEVARRADAVRTIARGEQPNDCAGTDGVLPGAGTNDDVVHEDRTGRRSVLDADTLLRDRAGGDGGGGGAQVSSGSIIFGYGQLYRSGAAADVYFPLDPVPLIGDHREWGPNRGIDNRHYVRRGGAERNLREGAGGGAEPQQPRVRGWHRLDVDV